jgi:hypothetical protein
MIGTAIKITNIRFVAKIFINNLAQKMQQYKRHYCEIHANTYTKYFSI